MKSEQFANLTIDNKSELNNHEIKTKWLKFVKIFLSILIPILTIVTIFLIIFAYGNKGNQEIPQSTPQYEIPGTSFIQYVDYGGTFENNDDMVETFLDLYFDEYLLNNHESDNIQVYYKIDNDIFNVKLVLDSGETFYYTYEIFENII